MSLTTFIDTPDVMAQIKPLRPKLPRQISTPLKVAPHSNRYAMVGTAFDYLLRFELQRRASHALAEPWVAEFAPDRIWRETDTGGVGMDLLGDPRQKDWMPPDEVAKRTRSIIEEAKKAVDAYIKSKAPDRAKQAEIAAHAIRLAKLDLVIRALRLDPQFEVAQPEDVQDLLAIIAIVPFDALLHKKVMYLNPTFGESSTLVGGADADLITGDMLVDFKTTKNSEIPVPILDQMLGYFLLARNQQRTNPRFPKINKIGLYFCRHGYLWTMNTTTWTSHPQFAEIEEWFFKRAKEVRDLRGQRQ